MNYLQMLQEIFNVCIIPLLGVLTTYIVKFIRKKSDELKVQTDNELLNKYINLLTETIEKCVVATNQTYVDNLKDKNAFDEAAQKEAFKNTFDSVMNILSKDAKDYLQNALGDVNIYVTQLIEYEVSLNKKFQDE